MMKNTESHPTERADLFGRRFVSTIETEDGKRIAESLTKQLTGGDRIRARFLHRDFFEFPPTHKIFLAANHKPTVRCTDLAMWRRIKLIPFTVTITDDRKDKTLLAKLRREFPGILAWAVRGCQQWQEGGLGEPAEVTQATQAYQAEMDVLAEFITERCFVNEQASVQATALYEAYCKFSGDKTTTQTAFGLLLRSKGYRSEKRGGLKYWHGIGLNPLAEDLAEEAWPFRDDE
jgi:putative DNA primase/helicase